MRKLKLWFLLGLLLVTVGCEAEYHLEFDKDLSVKEEITFIESNNVIYSYNNSIDNFINDTIYQLGNNYSANEYEINKKIDDIDSRVVATRSYNHFQAVGNDYSVLNELFNEIEITNDPYYDNLVMINFKAIADNNDFFINDEESEVLFEKITLTISIPYYVTVTNADYINQEQNLYSWYYDKDNVVKNVELEFDLKQPINQGFLNQIGSAFKIGNVFPFIVGGIVLSIVLLGGFYLVALIKHNNSI